MIGRPSMFDPQYRDLETNEMLRQLERDTLLYEQTMALKELSKQKQNNTQYNTQYRDIEPNITMTLSFDADGNIIDNTLDEMYEELDELKENKKVIEQKLTITPASFILIMLTCVIIGIVNLDYFFQINIIAFCSLYGLNILRKNYWKTSLLDVKDKIKELKKDIKEYEKDSK